MCDPAINHAKSVVELLLAQSQEKYKKGTMMFIVSITYTSEMSKIDKYLEEHISYLDKYYEKGSFIASGRKVPRTGGVILATAGNRGDLEQILDEDPFKVHHLADYEIIEFIPTKSAPELASLVQSNG
ncbi:YciI family protein [Vibrio tetraodonis]